MGGSRGSGTGSSSGDSATPTPRVGPPPAAPANWISSGSLPTPLPALTPARPEDLPGDDSSTAVGAPAGVAHPVPGNGGPSEADPPEVQLARADPRKRFGHFVLLSEIGKGGMGVVYRAWNERLSRVAALKMILPFDDETEAAVSRFHREAQAVARLRHPNIVSVHEAGIEDGKHYLAMDYVQGTTLERRLAQKDGKGSKKLPLPKAIEIVRDVARAVHHAHENGVIHRDLKPANIMLDLTDRPYVLDFGLATIRGASSGLTRSGARVGTPAYMPPEQANAAGDRVDERSDVYSLGATLYHVLTGVPPFQGSTEYAILAAVLMKDPKPPSTTNPRAAGDLDTICLRCLEKEREKRYPSAAALADELDRYIAGDPIDARPVGTATKLLRRAKRNKVSTGLAALALVLACVLGAAGIHFQGLKAKEEAERLGREAEAAKTAQALADHRREVLDVIARARAGKLGTSLDREQALLLLQHHAERQTVDILAGELESVRHELMAAAREVYLTAAEPNADEARAGQKPIEGIAAALDRAEALPAGAVLDGDSVEVLRRASVRVENREPPEGSKGTATPQRTFPRILASAQTKKLGGDAEVAKLACEALGRIGMPEAVPAIMHYLLAEADEVRATPAAIALCQLGGPDLERILLDARSRFGSNGPFWAQVKPFFQRVQPGAERETTDPDALLEQGNTKRDRGDYEGALRVYDRLIAIDPGSVGGWVQRAGARDAMGDHDGAISDATHAIELSPGCSAAWNNRGCARRKKGDLDGALADFSKAIELEPSSDADWHNRGEVEVEKGQLDAAISDLKHATEIGPSHPQNWAMLGDALALKARLGEAIDAYTKAIELDPRLAAAWSSRGNARWHRREKEAALADLTRSVELDPRDAQAWWQRGRVRLSLQDLDGAIDDFGRSLELDSGSARVWALRAGARVDRGDVDGGIADYARALELNPKDAGNWNDRGNARYSKGDAEGAIADYTRGIELAPDLAAIWYGRGNARLSKGDEKGVLDLSRAIELDPQLKQAWHRRGNARAEAGDVKGGLADISRAIEIDPRYASALDSRATLRRESGDLDGALADLDRALEVEPRYAAAWNNRANVRLAKDDVDGAIADYSRALDLKPRSLSAWVGRGNAKTRKGDYVGALSDLDRALELDSRSAGAWSNHGMARVLKGDVDQGISDFTRALELEPGAAGIWENRARARLRKEDFAGAIADATKALELEPGRAMSHFLRAEAERRKGDARAAIADYEKFLEVSGPCPEVDQAKEALAELRITK